MQIQINLAKKDLSLSPASCPSTKSPLFPDIKKRKYLNGPGPGKYSRSSSIGHQNHDVTLCRNPAYSIGKAVRVIDLNSNPFYGRLASAPGTRFQHRSPGPQTYEYEKHSNPFKTSVPAFSIGKAPRFPNYYVF